MNVILDSHEAVDVKDLPDFAGARVDQDQLTPDNLWTATGTLQEFKATSERAFLVARLRETGWNISKTAEVIDTPRSNLYKKLEQYQISQEKDG